VQVISAASDACERHRNTQITPLHLAVALVEDGTGLFRRLAERLGYEADKFAHAVRGKVAALPKQVRTA
jgi:ATP-dependent Clp protease ATP-binding subunit ClpA